VSVLTGTARTSDPGAGAAVALTVRSVRTLTPSAVEVTLGPPATAAWRYLPGQYLPVEVPVDGAVLSRCRPHAPAVSVPVPRGATLLEALEAASVPAAYSCRVGDCGTCHARLLRGEVAMSSVEGLLPEDEQAGHVLLCVARPVSGALHVELPT
jgi:3-ketosteroid 9alpha-monooxygenase subunit B